MVDDIDAYAVKSWNRGNPWKATFDQETMRVTFPDGRSCVASQFYAPFIAAWDPDRAPTSTACWWAASLKTFEPYEV